MKTWQLLDVVQLQQVKQGTQRVNKHSSDNWCQKSPPFLWSFVCSEKMFVFCDNSLCLVTGSTGLSLTSQLLSRYYLTESEIEFWLSACDARPSCLFSVIECWGTMFDIVAVNWYLMRIIIRSSSDKSVMICDTQNLRDIDPASQCGARSESFEWDGFSGQLQATLPC